MKKIMFCILTMLVGIGIQADDLTANVKMRDGRVCQIVMDASSEIELQKFMLKVHAPVKTDWDVLFLLEDVANMTFDSPFTGIQEVAGTPLKYFLNGEALSISGIEDCSFVQVYDESGILLNTVRVQEHSCNISLTDIPKGMLLVKVNRQTIKILKQ